MGLGGKITDEMGRCTLLRTAVDVFMNGHIEISYYFPP